MDDPRATLTAEQLDALGEELDALRKRLMDDLGEADVAYIRNLIKAQRALEISGRGLLFASFFPPAWVAGTAALSLSKILDNMEIGHNVMHGQYDWTGDPTLASSRFEWDTVCPADQWRHSHNYIHHTYTNILGKDRDIGYGVLRMSEQEPWRPRWLANPLYALALATFFQYGVALHDLEVENLGKREAQRPRRELLAGIWKKVRSQTLKDYVLFPLLAGPQAPLVLAGNATANLTRNLWAFAIIFCGHFPEGTVEFDELETAEETRGEWYLRQMLGSANLTGGPVFHILSGNLSHQIEHHLFPDIPARRYAEIAKEVKAICERYGLPYNAGPLHRQLGSVFRKIVRLALPGSGPASPASSRDGDGAQGEVATEPTPALAAG
ncbi:MAG TPA: acyl-CoA desaturase [Solirubrobacteraceae bacterium]|nr:acyl-CoA desaturase [Solirubrobacteraceae bacterium]